VAATRDLAAGGALCAVGTTMAVVAHGFPVVGGMPFGPGLFPKIIAAGLVASGIGIAAEGLATAKDRAAGGPGRHAGAMVGLLAVIAFFALALDPLGFHVTAAVSLLVSVWIFGGGTLVAIALAVIGSVGTHFVFYTILRVPLPWGLLEPVAW